MNQQDDKNLPKMDITRAARDSDSLTESDITLLRKYLKSKGNNEEDEDISDLSVEEITIQTGRFEIDPASGSGQPKS